jgi:hypothetical protein
VNDNAKLWVDALRSGKYEQGTGVMKDGEEFCCLGVACEVYRLETGTGQWNKIPHGQRRWATNTTEEFFGYWAILPPEVSNWLGIASHNVPEDSVPENSSQADLYKMNDDGTSFAEIADYIESEPEGLFVGGV